MNGEKRKRRRKEWKKQIENRRKAKSRIVNRIIYRDKSVFINRYSINRILFFSHRRKNHFLRGNGNEKMIHS
jgi:hypothetical protein